jgi:small GTP-binding protein
MVSRKICLIGAFGVGKSSLVRRFVESLFDETYQTTIGVKIDKKVVTAGERQVTLVIWDMAGADDREQVRMSHLAGAAGCILVVDRTRASTLECAVRLKRAVAEAAGDLPCVVALNKADLCDEWVLEPGKVDEALGAAAILTSAKTGDSVERLFQTLVLLMFGHA